MDVHVGPLKVDACGRTRRAETCARRSYQREIELLKSNNQAKLLRNSFIIKLSPILHDNLLRVGGRLDHADVSYDVKHPVILPRKHSLTELLIRDCHENNGHVGAQQVISLLREKYWITQATTAARRVLQECFSCRRRNRMPCSQKMARYQLKD